MPWASDPEIASLRDLAGRKGLGVIRSTLVKHYALVDSAGAKVTNSEGTKAFTIKELRALLKKCRIEAEEPTGMAAVRCQHERRPHHPEF